MGKASASSSSSSRTRSETNKSSKTHRTTTSTSTSTCTVWFELINDDVLQKILEKLPALSFASAACVSKTWNQLCNRILSRPKISSALSLNPSPHIAVQEVFDKVLSRPIRPHFAIANIGSRFRLFEAFGFWLITKRLGSNTPFIISVAGGIIGRDALTNEFKEVMWGDITSDSDDEVGEYIEDINDGIVLTVGYVPGLKVEAMPKATPLLRIVKEPQVAMFDKFVKDIKDFKASVSRCISPAGIIMSGEGPVDLKPVIDLLGNGWLPLVDERFLLLPVTWGRVISSKFVL
ncbi:F-box/LRR-repeat protein At5g63520-like isoform X1 [Quercus robur]|uniref:F-box/LRR-repeat protein At5g63520-like isoform X1 n=1 Tax=Quercus robur TaxID=38942 RepID=UPI002163E9B4|nr:F-box/LRR-repeat protein At5g63520-like isoform X1 [Quercus robur]